MHSVKHTPVTGTPHFSRTLEILLQTNSNDSTRIIITMYGKREIDGGEKFCRRMGDEVVCMVVRGATSSRPIEML